MPSWIYVVWRMDGKKKVVMIRTFNKRTSADTLTREMNNYTLPEGTTYETIQTKVHD